MKITKVESFLLKKKPASSMAISRGGFNVRTHLIVQVHTDEGVTGLGEGVGNAPLIQAIINHSLANQAVGLDPFNIETLRQKLMDSHVYFERKGSAICAFSALEMACWDIKGKALNVPVYQLLGGLFREKIETYASDIYWEEDLQKMAKNVERIIKNGFTAIKAHIGCRSPEEDLTRVKCLREVAGKKIKLMIDLNGGYSAMDAFHAANLWKPFDLFWLEEPVEPDHVEQLADLRLRSGVPIAAGENEFRIHGFKDLFENKSIDVAMPDIGRVGGLQETKNICNLAEAYGLPVSPHNFSSGVLLAATIHLMASTPNTMMLEFDGSENAVYQDMLIHPLEIKNGFVRVPNQPGLGVHLPKEIIQKYGN